MIRRVRAVLFDLDGTLVDSAPDMAAAANVLRARHGLPELPLQAYRSLVGSGARGMLSAALSCRPGDRDYEDLRAAFLAIYAEGLLHRTQVFDGMQAVLRQLDAEGLRWGIVTNKALALARPIVDGLGLAARAGVLIGGDSTAHTKPHPLPLLEAARQLDLRAQDCVYVGDDPRDVQAGRSAGMATLAAAWGYLGIERPIHEWGADAVLGDPPALLNWLDLA